MIPKDHPCVDRRDRLPRIIGIHHLLTVTSISIPLHLCHIVAEEDPIGTHHPRFHTMDTGEHPRIPDLSVDLHMALCTIPDSTISLRRGDRMVVAINR